MTIGGAYRFNAMAVLVVTFSGPAYGRVQLPGCVGFLRGRSTQGYSVEVDP